jgi:hypothetical protein
MPEEARSAEPCAGGTDDLAAEVARALSERFRDRGWRCQARSQSSPAGGPEIVVMDHGTGSSDRLAPTFPVDWRVASEQAESILAALDDHGWAGRPLLNAALWCEPV